MNSKIFVVCFIVVSGIVTSGHGNQYCLRYFDKFYQDLVAPHLNDLRRELEKSKYTCGTNSPRQDPPIFDERFDTLPEKCKTETIPKNCAKATACTQRSGIYKIRLEKYSPSPFLVECDAKTEGGGWTLIQRREDGSVDFYRDWFEYKNGFGNIDGEFFIGLDKLHALTNFDGPQELLVMLEAKNASAKALYSHFVIGDESDSYDLKLLGYYSGDAGDSLKYHLGSKFSTKDRDNDNNNETNCAKEYIGAWWYNACLESSLNGKFDEPHYEGFVWNTFRDNSELLRGVKMMIRRRTF